MSPEIKSPPTDKRYDLAVFIGRFQPFHKGHKEVLFHALGSAERVLILIGSTNRARDTRNPFTYDERRAIIRAAVAELPGFTDEGLEEFQRRIDIRPLPDHPYDRTRWIEAVQHKVGASHEDVLRPRICLTGHERDDTSDYLNWFPQWDLLPCAAGDNNATAIRKAYFNGAVDFHAKGWTDTGLDWGSICDPAAIRFLDGFRGKEAYKRLMEDQAKEKAYHEEWGHKAPHLTADSVIVQSGHVAVITRGPGTLGEGQTALPGGFKNVGEPLIKTSLREAVEETSIFWRGLRGGYGRLEDDLEGQALAQAELRQFYLAQRTFDDPHRSRRGDIVTQAHLYKLPDGPLHLLRGADDASEAFWLPISSIRGEDFFEDHWAIIDRMLNFL